MGMSHYLKNFVPTEERVSEVRKTSKRKSVRQNIEALHRFSLFNQPIRCRGTDGRTYDYIDENGKHVSHFISQFSPLINDNLEPEISLLVRVLHSKGYLTLGSCQGHSDSKYRWITVVFPEAEQMKTFQAMIDSFELPITWYDNFLNFREAPKQQDGGFQLAFTWDQFSEKERSLNKLRKQGYSEAELTKYLNIMYSRNHQKYHLVKMVICSKLGNLGLLEKLKWNLMYRKRNLVTEQLVSKIHLSEFVTL